MLSGDRGERQGPTGGAYRPLLPAPPGCLGNYAGDERPGRRGMARL